MRIDRFGEGAVLITLSRHNLWTLLDRMNSSRASQIVKSTTPGEDGRPRYVTIRAEPDDEHYEDRDPEATPHEFERGDRSLCDRCGLLRQHVIHKR